MSYPPLSQILHHAPNCPQALAEHLIQHYTTQSLLALPTEALSALGLHPACIHYLQQQDWPAVNADLAWQAQTGNYVISYEDKDYPPLLKNTVRPPLILYATGNIALLNTPQIAMVGTRQPSPAGLQHAYQFAYALSEAGLCITSGLALGIDGACHRGALAAKGPTIAVLGQGLLHTYPIAHRTLQATIANEGLLLSEFSLHTKPLAANFPRRNRIISGLSLAVFVIEAALKSGSLITARLAIEQGRDVFALPGSIHSPQARGCHQLIKQGAKLVESLTDILEELPILLQTQRQLFPEMTKTAKKSLDKIQENVLQYIDFSPTPVDLIITGCGLAAAEVHTHLLALELAGWVSASEQGYTRIG